ncbi:MAG: hypothetical protein IPP77_02455 [Bacteroidetes bacterium]|nr:hypothetical protein [Bacteroidota bacterium]
MQSRFTAKGVNNEGKEVILAYELKEDAFQVGLYIVPGKSLKAEDKAQLESKWVNGEEFVFPEATVYVNPNLNSESILPVDILSEETGKIRIKQNEWAYTLLTAKLWESYLQELEKLKERASGLKQYERQLFDDAKSFWERVLEHRKERDISQERLDKIKEEVNAVFEKLKTFRKTESVEFEAASAKFREETLTKLDEVKKRADEKANFKLLIDDLKALQNQSRKNRYSKVDELEVRKQFDSVFQHINHQRDHYFSDKNAIRIKGLAEVIDKMEASLARDQRDLDHLNKKANSNSVQSLELQLIKVKTNMLNETMASKVEKLKDIHATMEKLQKHTNRGNKTKEITPSKELSEDNMKAEEAIQPDAPTEAQPEN